MSVLTPNQNEDARYGVTYKQLTLKLLTLMYNLQNKNDKYKKGVNLSELVSLMKSTYKIQRDLKVRVYSTLQKLCCQGLVAKRNGKNEVKYRLVGPVACLMNSSRKKQAKVEDVSRALKIFWGDRNEKAPGFKPKASKKNARKKNTVLPFLHQRMLEKFKFWKRFSKKSSSTSVGSAGSL